MRSSMPYRSLRPSLIDVGVRILSGSAACRWYIDEDIPDINSFRARFILHTSVHCFFILCSFHLTFCCHLVIHLCSLGEEFVPLASYVPTGPDALMSRAQDTPTVKTVKELTDLDPFVDMVSGCRVLVQSIIFCSRAPHLSNLLLFSRTSATSVLSLLTVLALISVGGSLRVRRAASHLNIMVTSTNAQTILAPLLMPTQR